MYVNDSSSIFSPSSNTQYCLSCTTPSSLPQLPPEKSPFVSQCREGIMKEIFDSGCNFCLSGCPNRLRNAEAYQSHNGVMGFNGTSSTITATGVNHYGVQEHYVEGMPSDLCLLCAQQFAKQGAAILFGDCGYVLRLDSDKLQQLNQFISDNPILLRLSVQNNVYYV